MGQALHSDGTFIQIFQVPVKRTFTNSGEWNLHGSEIELKNFCFVKGDPAQQEPIRDIMTWSVVDSPIAGELALYGGDGDPDHYEILVRARKENPPH